MNLIKTLCGKCADCLSSCFSSDNHVLREKMNELQQRIHRNQIQNLRITHSSSQSSRQKQAPLEIEMRSPLIHRIKSKSIEHEKMPMTLRKQQSTPENHRQSNNSVDSFFTMNSGSNSNHSITRRTFKLVKSASKISSKNQNQFKLISNRESSAALISAGSKQDKYSQLLIEWNEKEYQKPQQKSYKPILTASQLNKLQNNVYLDQAVNKLEDYYIFYINQDLSTSSSLARTSHQQKLGYENGYYVNHSTGVRCSYHCEDGKISNSQNLYMRLISFFCNTTNSMQFLKWYNFQDVRSKLYDFNRIILIENGIFPVFEIEQYGAQLQGKNVYTIIRQIELVKFENEPDKQYVLQLDISINKSTLFRSLLRFQVAENAEVEIYSESSEKIARGTHGEYFVEKWRNFEEKMVRDKIIPMYSKIMR